MSELAAPALPPGCNAATVYEAAGQRGALDPEIRRMVPGGVVAGPALPVRCAPGDNLAIHRAVAEARPGEVLVVAGAGVRVGYLGDVLVAAALARGVAGAVVDGGARDVPEIAADGFPLWARGPAIPGAQKRTPGVVGEPVVCGGVLVERGSWVIADDDGVVVIGADELDATLAAAAARLAFEERVKRGLADGDLTLDLLGLRDAIG